MLGPLVNAITSNTFQTLAQNTDACVKLETTLKAVGRPAFTLVDKHTDKETRKYAATKEFLYQILCLGIYMAIIPPIFKNGGFKLFQKIFKNEQMPAFRSAKQMMAYHHLAYMKPAERTIEHNIKNTKYINLLKLGDKDGKELTDPKTGKSLLEYLFGDKDKKINPLEKRIMEKEGKMFDLAKGSIELSSIVGSVIGLTILAPEISHIILHPVMKALHLEGGHEKAAEESKKIDKNA